MLENYFIEINMFQINEARLLRAARGDKLQPADFTAINLFATGVVLFPRVMICQHMESSSNIRDEGSFYVVVVVVVSVETRAEQFIGVPQLTFNSVFYSSGFHLFFFAFSRTSTHFECFFFLPKICVCLGLCAI